MPNLKEPSPSSPSSASQPNVSAQTSNVAVGPVSNPRLTEPDPASIRTFLKQYDLYRQTIIARAKQLQPSSEGSSTTTTEVILPMQLKYCVDAKHFSSCIALGFIDGVTSFDAMTDEQLRTYLDKEAEYSKDAVTLEGLDELIEKKLKMNMEKKNARSRMQRLFANYHSLLTENGVKWIIQENQKLAVTHVLSAIRPQPLRERLESDLPFSHHE